ncbi:MAG: insulinase family protein [Aquificae bacterium]|nr:insulinase family protein [Aquificota bacterium]
MLRAFFLGVILMVGTLLAQELYIRDLQNGVKLIVRPRKDTKAVSLQVWIKVGSVYEKYDEKGMAHFLEHMVFNGTEKYRYGEIDRLIESLGGNINAGTSKDYTYYHVEIAHTYWREALDVLHQLTMRALLEEEMIEKEKKIVIEEIRRAKDNPNYVLWNEFEKLVYKVSPYRFPVIGFEETVSKFTRPMLLRFYKSFYVPKNIAVVVVGNVEPSEVEKEVKKTFGSEPFASPPKVRIPNEPPQKGIRFKKLEDKRVQKAHWVIGWRVPAIGKNEYKGLIILTELLCGGRISLFYRELREKGLVYSYWCGDLGRPRDNIFVVKASFQPERYEEVKKRVFELMEELYKTLTDEQVEEAKRRIINARLFEQERVENEAYDIGYAYTVVGDLDFYRFFEKNVMRARRVDVLRIFERYIKKDVYSEVLMVPKDEKGDSS